ncbi:hypothetical protein LL946_07850 [Knoellia locipacati]|uniref:hypothetical protein n=1 Tax=Knoellia locipacati TaxID=882824 RepID=UPI00384B7EF4
MDAAGWEQQVDESDWRGLQRALTSLDDEGRAAALTWYRRTGRARARKVSERDWRPHSRIVQLQLALGLSETPQEASKNCQWGRRWIWSDDLDAVPGCADLLLARGEEWARAFVTLSTATTLRGDSRRGAGEITTLASAAVDAFDLDTPLEETYVRGWTTLVGLAHSHTRADKGSQWRPLTLLAADDSGAHAAYPLGPEASLEACLHGTRDLTALLVAALDLPNALAEWTDLKGEGWGLTAAIRAAVADGILDREAALDPAFRSLSRDDRAGTQRVTAQVILGLEPTPDEVRERAALILHVLPTVHGSVTTVLLDLALAAGLEDDDLVELGTVVLARKEKAQKATLLRHLKTSTSDAREPLLAMAADSDDAAFAAKARALLGDGDDESADGIREGAGRPDAVSTWSRPATGFRPGDFSPYAGDAAGLDRARSDSETWLRITSEAAWLDLVVRVGAKDLDVLRASVVADERVDWWSAARTRALLHQWVTTGDPHRSYRRTGTMTTHEPGKDPVTTTRVHEWVPPGCVVFTDRLVEESLRRLGTVTELLSTPSRVDGTVTVADLAARVRRASRAGYAPYDLVQALLRLDLRDADDVGAFDGLTLPPAAVPSDVPKEQGSSWRRLLGRGGSRKGGGSGGGGASAGVDGVEVIRGWIAAGGMPRRELDFDGTRPRLGGVTLPLPGPLAGLDGLAEICAAVGHGDSNVPAGLFDSPTLVLGVTPFATEVAVTTTEQRGDLDSVFHAQNLPVLAWSAGPIGAATHHHIARLLVHPREDSRLLAAKYTAELATQGRLDPELLGERSLSLFEAGELSLPRAAHGWEQLASMAGLAVVWPAWVAVLDEACRASRKPAGLADLLRAARDQVPVAAAHVEGEVLPASVREVAGEKGRGKAVTEARALVDLAALPELPELADSPAPDAAAGPDDSTGTKNSEDSEERSA